MGKDYRISGAVTLTARGTQVAEKRVAEQPSLPASITFDPVGIDLFAMILHCVYAVKMSFKQDSAGRSRKDAGQYVQAHVPFGFDGKPRVEVGMEWTDDEAIVFTLASTTQSGQSILAARSAVIRVQPRKPWKDCLELKTKAGVWVRVDITQVQTRFPL